MRDPSTEPTADRRPDPAPSTADRVLPALPLVFGLVASAEHAALLRAALESGLLARCSDPATVEELAAGLRRDPATIRDLCVALDAHGVLDRAGDTYQVSGEVEPLLDPGGTAYALDLLRYGAARRQLVERLVTEPGDFWSSDPQAQTALAAGVTLPPHTDLARELIGANFASVPGIRQALESGGRYLELGCGVGGALLTAMQLFPLMTAVAVDLSPTLLARARASAVSVGVQDRVSFLLADATRLEDSGPLDPFDVVFWSQFYFPGPTRAAALATARRALRPGGHLMSPVMADGSVLEDDLRSPEGREAALDRLVHGSWGCRRATPGTWSRRCRRPGSSRRGWSAPRRPGS